MADFRITDEQQQQQQQQQQLFFAQRHNTATCDTKAGTAI